MFSNPLLNNGFWVLNISAMVSHSHPKLLAENGWVFSFCIQTDGSGNHINHVSINPIKSPLNHHQTHWNHHWSHHWNHHWGLHYTISPRNRQIHFFFTIEITLFFLPPHLSNTMVHPRLGVGHPEATFAIPALLVGPAYLKGEVQFGVISQVPRNGRCRWRPWTFYIGDLLKVDHQKDNWTELD